MINIRLKNHVTSIYQEQLLTRREPKRQISPKTPRPIFKFQRPNVIVVQPHIFATDILGALGWPKALLESSYQPVSHAARTILQI